MGLHLWVVYVRPLTPEFRIPPEHAARFKFRRVTLDEAVEQSRLNPELSMSETFLNSAFERGDICLGAFDDGRLIAYSWRTLDRAPVNGHLWLKLVGRGCCYGYKALVLPQYRGQRLNKSVRTFYDDHMVAMGIRHIVGYIDLHNLASIRAHEGLRQEAIGIAGYLRWPRSWTPFRTRRVRPHLEFQNNGLQ